MPFRRALLDRLRAAIRVRRYSIRTEDAYADWARRFILFHEKRHPSKPGALEVAAFSTYLAGQRNVAASTQTQTQARSALLFLYRVVLGVELPWLDEVVGAKTPRRLLVALTPGQVRSPLHELDGTMGLVASVLYGTGMRLLEGLRVRVKDIDFEREIVIRDGRGGRDRVTVLPENLMLPLAEHISRRRALHNMGLAASAGEVWLPDALAVKYPRAPKAVGCGPPAAGPGPGRAAPECNSRRRGEWNDCRRSPGKLGDSDARERPRDATLRR